MTSSRKFWIILTLFLASVNILNIVSVKIVEVYGLAFSFGTYLYALTFPLTDTVSEVWGRARARTMVFLGLLANLLVVGAVSLSVWHPPADFWADANLSYVATLGAVPRVLLGSMLAYTVAQLHDVWAFHFWKKVTAGRKLWLRNNLSTVVSQFLDTTIFTVVAFYGIVPTGQLPAMVLTAYVIKLLLAVVDTPVVYLLVRWASGRWSNPEIINDEK